MSCIKRARLTEAYGYKERLRLVEALTRHQSAVLNEYKALRDRVEKLEKELK